MNREKYINASCVISNGAVEKNGALLFAGRQDDVMEFLLSIYKYLGTSYARFYKMDNLSKLGWLASEVLLKEDFQSSKYKAEEVGIVLSNANASLDTDAKYAATMHGIPSPSVFVYTLPNIVTGEICIRNHFKGENAFFISETFDESLIYNYVCSLMENNILKMCICGWVELLGDSYRAVLFLVEQHAGEHAMVFNEGHLRQIFNGEKQV